MNRVTKKLFLPGYVSSIQDVVSKKRYLDKMIGIGGLDPYETDRTEWQDDIIT